MQPVVSALETLIGKDYRYPLGKVSVYNTTKSVPSNGFNVSYYGTAIDTDMSGEWWSGLSSDPPADRDSEGTFLDGTNIIEPSTILAFDWGVGGVPPPVNDGRIDQWAARWRGYFYARYTGTYRFYIDCSPHARIRIKMDGDYYGNTDTDFTDEDSNSVDRWDEDDANFAKTRQELYFDIALTTNTWYTIQVEFYIPRQSAPQNIHNYLCVKYREPDATTAYGPFGDTGGNVVGDYQSDYQDEDGNDIKKPLSAGVVNTTNAFLTAVEVPGVMGFAGTKTEGQVSEYSFDVKVPASTNLSEAANSENHLHVYSTDGFPDAGALCVGTNPDSITIVTYTGKTAGSDPQFTGCSNVGSFANASLVSQFYGEGASQYIAGYDSISGNFGPLKAPRLVKIEGGLYNGVDTDYYTSRIWGNLFPNPVINRDAKKMTWRVQDFSWMLNRKTDHNYPDQASYSMAGYYLPYSYDQPDGITRPPCYDRWRADKAIRDILMKAGVDPILLWQRERIQISGAPAYASDYGDYLLKGELILDSKPFYGNPTGIEGTSPDEQYVWSFGYGSKLWENLSELIKNFAYIFSFTNDGFAKSKAYGIPEHEFYPDDTLGELTFTGAAWNDDDDNIDDLNTFRGRYRKSSNATDKVALTAAYPYWSDAEIILQRHDGANQQIKIKIGASYIDTIWLNGDKIEAVADVFTIPSWDAGETWSYYDGLDPDTGENPSIIKIEAPVSYDTQLLQMEVSAGETRFNAMFLYARGTRDTIRTIDEEDMGTLRLEKDVVNQRNEVTVVGSEQGQAKSSAGAIINPNNPVYIHTISRAVDLRSLYENDYKHYIGHSIPFDIFDERILDQERADYVAEHALTRYKGQDVGGDTAFLFDPRLEINDSIALEDQHTKLTARFEAGGEYHDTTQLWLKSISEKYSVGADGSRSYITSLNGVSPRQPMPSMRFKPEPNIEDWDNEPIVNIGLYYRGYRISGGDATLGDVEETGRTITMANDPDWPVDYWIGYFVVDEEGREFEIESNTNNDLVLTEAPYEWSDGNWAITFDPLDSETGDPIEIRYDQIKTGKVNIQIIGLTGGPVADLNKDTRSRVINWGPNKRIFWNGEIHYGFKENKENYLVSPYTLENFRAKLPLAVRFVIEHNDSATIDIILTHAVDHSQETYYGNPMINGIDETQQNTYGACKIVPKLLDDGYTIGWTASGNFSGSDNEILDAGRVYKITDQGGGTYRLFLEGRGTYNAIVADEYNGKFVISGKSGDAKEIQDSGNDGTDGWIDIDCGTNALRKVQGWSGSWNIYVDEECAEDNDTADWFWVRIVENKYQPIYFKETDNSGRGLCLKFTDPAFWVEGLDNTMFQNGFALPDSWVLACLYKTDCERELTVHYEGNSYTIDAGSELKLAHFGVAYPPRTDIALQDRVDRDVINDIPDGDHIFVHFSFYIFWSKYYPTRLFMCPGQHPDPHNPGEGTFVVAELTNSALPAAAIKTTLRCPTKEPKAASFVMAPFLEIHQLTRNDALSDIDPYNRGDYYMGFGEEGAELVHELPAFTSFMASRDLVIYINPNTLINPDGNNVGLYFWENLSPLWGGYLPQYAMWHFLVKLVIEDRVGRTPRNWVDFDIFDQQEEEEIMSSQHTFSDWNGITAFWHPGDDYTAYAIGDGSNALALKNLANCLNLGRTVPLIMWKPT